MEKQELIDMAISRGYKQVDGGYKNVTKNNTHWLNLFDETNRFQMHAYETNKVHVLTCTSSWSTHEYDTGTIEVSSMTPVVMNALFDCLLNNHD